MKTILALAGSTSKHSINKQLLSNTTSLFAEHTINFLDLNDFEMPIFSVDRQAENGFPAEAHLLFNHFKSADAFILSLAEHNGAYSAAFKNCFDWLTRIEPGIFFEKPMLLMATSTGVRGGLTVLEIAKERFPRHKAYIVATFSLPSFKVNFAEGKIIDSTLNNAHLEVVNQFKKGL